MFVLDFLTPECRNEFVEIFGSSETAIDFYIHSYVDFKAKGGRLTKEHIKAIKDGAKAISHRRNNIYGMSFIYFPKTDYGREVLAMHFEFEEVDPDCWTDDEGNYHSTFDMTLKAVQKAVPNFEVDENCCGIDIHLIN